MKAHQFADLNTIKRAVVEGAAKAVAASAVAPAAVVVRKKPDPHPSCNRGKLVMMAMKINRKYHPEMFHPNGSPRLDVGNFGSL
jgi:hypothetical protein